MTASRERNVEVLQLGHLMPCTSPLPARVTVKRSMEPSQKFRGFPFMKQAGSRVAGSVFYGMHCIAPALICLRKNVSGLRWDYAVGNYEVGNLVIS